MLAVGVDQYAEPRLKLAYATSDAKTISGALAQAGKALFDDVKVTSVLDTDVTVSGLDTAFAKVAKAVKPEDTFVFFLAGHGRTIADRYYFVPQDFRYGAGRTYQEWIG